MYVTICKARARVRSGRFCSNWDNLPVNQQGQGADGYVEIGARRASVLDMVIWACRTSISIGRCDVPYNDMIFSFIMCTTSPRVAGGIGILRCDQGIWGIIRILYGGKHVLFRRPLLQYACLLSIFFAFTHCITSRPLVTAITRWLLTTSCFLSWIAYLSQCIHT